MPQRFWVCDDRHDRIYDHMGRDKLGRAVYLCQWFRDGCHMGCSEFFLTEQQVKEMTMGGEE